MELINCSWLSIFASFSFFCIFMYSIVHTILCLLMYLVYSNVQMSSAFHVPVASNGLFSIHCSFFSLSMYIYMYSDSTCTLHLIIVNVQVVHISTSWSKHLTFFRGQVWNMIWFNRTNLILFFLKILTHNILVKYLLYLFSNIHVQLSMQYLWDAGIFRRIGWKSPLFNRKI